MKRTMEIKQEREKYLELIQILDESTEDYLFLWDIRAGRLYFSKEIHKKYPLPFRGKEGNTIEEWKDIVYVRDRKEVEKQLALLAIGQKETQQMEYRIVDKEGHKEWISCGGKVQFDMDGNPSVMIGRVSDKALLRKTDILTGLFSVDKFIEDMKICLERKKTGYLLILGIDNLKNINIKYGRRFGNTVLKKLTEVLEDCVDSTGMIYRLDGDQFAVNLPEEESKKIEELYKMIGKKMKEYCTLSAGAVLYTAESTDDWGTVYQYAEDAMDRAKKDGKNTLVFFSPDYYRRRLDSIVLQEEMRESVKEGCAGFYLCYQPLIDSRTFEIRGAEALLRYESPTRGKIGPMEFIPLLEQTELICEVGDWVLETALNQCKEWREEVPEFHMNVNLSYVQLRKEEITGKILEVLQKTGLLGSCLTLELTESMQLQDYEYFNRIFYSWKEHGIRIAIDDFGTGYSSLSYLQSIAVDETKIDRCFVNHIQHSAYNYQLLSNVIDLAHSAEIKVCCEGVETEGELLALKELDPDVLQGYLFAKPCEREVFEKLYIQSGSEDYQERVKKEERFKYLESGTDKKILEHLRKEDLGTIVESLDDIIYVSDIDTNELYYLNAAGRRMTGYLEYKGCKCYQVLMDRNTPCERCSHFRLERNNFHVSEIEDKFLNRHFKIKDKAIPWRGKMARLEIAINMAKTGEDLCGQVTKTDEGEKGKNADLCH